MWLDSLSEDRYHNTLHKMLVFSCWKWTMTGDKSFKNAALKCYWEQKQWNEIAVLHVLRNPTTHQKTISNPATEMSDSCLLTGTNMATTLSKSRSVLSLVHSSWKPFAHSGNRGQIVFGLEVTLGCILHKENYIQGPKYTIRLEQEIDIYPLSL